MISMIDRLHISIYHELYRNIIYLLLSICFGYRDMDASCIFIRAVTVLSSPPRDPPSCHKACTVGSGHLFTRKQNVYIAATKPTL